MQQLPDHGGFNGPPSAGASVWLSIIGRLTFLYERIWQAKKVLSYCNPGEPELKIEDLWMSLCSVISKINKIP
jgi:hypothetical protein